MKDWNELVAEVDAMPEHRTKKALLKALEGISEAEAELTSNLDKVRKAVNEAWEVWDE